MSFHIKAAMMEEMGHYDIYTRVYMVINYSDRCWCGGVEVGCASLKQGPQHHNHTIESMQCLRINCDGYYVQIAPAGHRFGTVGNAMQCNIGWDVMVKAKLDVNWGAVWVADDDYQVRPVSFLFKFLAG